MVEIILAVLLALIGLAAGISCFAFVVMALNPTGHGPGQTPPWRPVWISGCIAVASFALSTFLFFGG